MARRLTSTVLLIPTYQRRLEDIAAAQLVLIGRRSGVWGERSNSDEHHEGCLSAVLSVYAQRRGSWPVLSCSPGPTGYAGPPVGCSERRFRDMKT
jgi:hypothetical protein